MNLLKRGIKVGSKTSLETPYSDTQVVLRMQQARGKHQNPGHQDELRNDYLEETDRNEGQLADSIHDNVYLQEDNDDEEDDYTVEVDDGLEHDLDPYDGPRERRKDNTMLELLQARRSLGVTNPRDMIYAHVGLASDGQKQVVDYSKTCAYIFEKFARYIAKKEGLYILIYNIGEGKSPSRPSGLPSWVPDWTEPRFQVFRGWLHNLRNTDWELARKIQRAWRIFRCHLLIRNPSILIIFSFEIDTVVSASSVLSVQDIPLNVRETMSARLTELDRGLRRSGEYDPEFGQREALEDARAKLVSDVWEIWRSVVRNDDILPPDLEGRGHISFDPACYLWLEGTPVQKILIYVLGAGANTKYVDGRALARLASGRLALVPGPTQKGVTICTYRGNSLLGQFVCRQFSGQNDIEANIRRKFQSIAKGETLFSGGKKVDMGKTEEDTTHLDKFPVLHCTFVGRCVTNSLKVVEYPKDAFIVALY
jgi:hypothetical protein